MIIGTGSDLIDIERIARTLDKFGERFIRRCFTPTEIARAERRRAAGLHIATYAKRFAAKEACSKALGTGFNEGVYMRDIGVVNDPTGRPTLALTGGAARRLQFLVPEGMVATIHLTLTDEPPSAFAGVLIEALAARPVRDY
jgi:holo-[acyl-carrier protein] synthase